MDDTDGSQQIEMEIIESYVVPWALRGEDIPIHIRWKQGAKFDSIRVAIPPVFVVRDLMNVRNCSSDDQILQIKDLAQDGYFGLAISSDRHFDTQTVEEEVVIQFLQGNRVEHEERLVVHLFRPFMKVLEHTQKLTLSDDTTSKGAEKILIRLKYTGFGDAFVAIRTKIGGVWRSTGEKFYYQLVRLLLDRYGKAEAKPGPKLKESFEDKGRSRVSDDSGQEVIYERELVVEEIKRHLERYVYKKSVSVDALTDAELEDVKRLLDSLKERLTDREFADEFYSHLSAVVFEVLINSLKRNPADNVYLRDSDNTAIIEKAVKSLSVMVEYKDALENHYDPVELSVEIEDLRTTKSGVSIPIELQITSEVIDAIKGEIHG